MNDQQKAIARVAATIVLVLLLSLTLVAALTGGPEAVAATLGTLLILAIPLVVAVGVLLLVLRRI